MNLTEFSQAMFATPQEASKFFNLLMDTYPQDNYATPIIQWYQNISNSLKDKKVFDTLMVKYFQTYPLNKENILVFEEYANTWTEKIKKSILEKNPELKSNQSEFKNAKIFAQVVYSEFRRYNPQTSRYHNGYEFLEKHHDTICHLLKNKSKFIEQFEKEDVWGQMIMENYLSFKNFCVRYDIDSLAIMKHYLFETQRDLTILTRRLTLTPEVFRAVLDDAQSQSNLIEHSYLLKPYLRTEDYKPHLNLIDTAVILLNEGHDTEASMLFERFPQAAKDCFQAIYPDRNIDIYDNELWINYIEKVKDNKERNSGTKLKPTHIHKLIEREKEIGKVLQFAKLHADLKQNLEEKPNAKVRKI